MSPGKEKSSARFRIDYELKGKIIADYENGESVDELTAKYNIPHPEYVRRIVKNIRRESLGESSSQTVPKKVASPAKNVSPANAPPAPVVSSRKIRLAKKRKPNDSGLMEVDDEVSFILHSSMNNSVFNNNSLDANVSSCRHAGNESLQVRPKTKSTSTAISPESRRVRFGGESAGSQTETAIIDETTFSSLQAQFADTVREKNQFGDALVAADYKIASLEAQLRLKEELLQSKEKEVQLKSQENEAHCDHARAWRVNVDEKIKSVEGENWSLKQRIVSLEEQIRSQDKASEGYLKQIHSLKEQVENKEEQIRNLQSELCVKQGELEQGRERIRKLESSWSNLNEQMNVLRARMQQQEGWKKYF